MTYSTRENDATESDEALMAAVCDDAPGAFDRLVRRYESPLFNYACRLLEDRVEAQDVFQEAFLRVYQHRARYRRGALVRPWVYRIATNLCRDRLRARRRRRNASFDAPVSGVAGSQSFAETLADVHPKPDAIARANEVEQRLRTAIRKLPVKQQTVFLMARYQDMPYGEIARALFIPVGTVKSRMNKAVTFLMDEMKDFLP
ncbi:MAG: sigma-70 family RNA polymerase sigma factor [Candidatus Hydrogenedentes bacterium]|nr:sigma-70 family RNA polymerase sigma factor [Candidatus Hydrogenedentota bacterium]